jgi:hypothetical protein
MNELATQSGHPLDLERTLLGLPPDLVVAVFAGEARRRTLASEEA